VQNTIGVRYEPELRLARTCTAAMDTGGPVHLASRETRSSGRIAHGGKGRVSVTQIIRVRQHDSLWLRKTGSRSLVSPVAGLDVILRSCRVRAVTASSGPERSGAQALKEIVRRAVLLNYHDYMLEVGDLCLTNSRAGANHQQHI